MALGGPGRVYFGGLSFKPSLNQGLWRLLEDPPRGQVPSGSIAGLRAECLIIYSGLNNWNRVLGYIILEL